MSDHLEVQDVYARVRHVLHTLRDASLVKDFPVCLWTGYGLKRECGKEGLPEWNELSGRMQKIFNIALCVDALDEREFKRQKQLANNLEKNLMEQLHRLFKDETAENLLRSLGWHGTERHERLRIEASRLKHDISKAIAAPARTALHLETGNPTSDAVDQGLSDWFDECAVRFLAKANEEPIRIVASLLEKMIGNRAMFVHFMNDLPMVECVSGDQKRFVHCLFADSSIVTLVQLDGKTIVGERVEAEELRVIFQEIGLPVWEMLQSGR